MADNQTHDFDTPDSTPIPESPSAWSSYILLIAAAAALALTLAAFAGGRTGWGITGLITTLVLAVAAVPLLMRAGRRVLSERDGGLARHRR